MSGEPSPADDPFADWQPLAPAAVRWHVLWAVVLVPVPILAALLAPLFTKIPAGTALVGGLILTGLLALNVLRTFVWARRFRYRLTASTVETRSFVLSVTTRIVPLGRIQHVDVTSGPIERMLEVATLSAHTAAGDSTIVLPGVAAGTADVLRDRLLRERQREAV